MDDGEDGYEDQGRRYDKERNGDKGKRRFAFGVFCFVFSSAEENVQQE
jgi:hypothetical protein